MGREVIRQNIVTAVEAAKAASTYPNIIVEYDNRIIVDTQTQTIPFLCVKIDFLRSEQLELSKTSRLRYHGFITLSAAVKVGKGTGDAYKVLDEFYPRLQARAFGTVRTFMADHHRHTEHLGWIYVPASIPFWSIQPF